MTEQTSAGTLGPAAAVAVAAAAIFANVAIHNALALGPCAIVVAVVVVALARLTAPNWPLAITAMAFSVLVIIGEIVGNLQVVEPRYVIASTLLLFAAWTPVTVFARLLAVVIGFDFRVVNNRSESPPWTAVVAAVTRKCMKPGMGDQHRHAWWPGNVPCGRG